MPAKEIFNTVMKVTIACTLYRRGDALFTDQPFSTSLWRRLRHKKKLRFTEGDRVVEIEVRAAEAAKKTDGEILAFVVPEMDEPTRAFVIGREFEAV